MLWIYLTSELDFDPSLVPPAHMRRNWSLHDREFLFANTTNLTLFSAQSPCGVVFFEEGE
jgi:hypothetical protein